MDNENSINQGEVLMILSKRSKMDGRLVAEKMGISKSYLSDAYRRPVLTQKIKLAAARVFGVDVSVFETGVGYMVQHEAPLVLGEPGELEALRDELQALKEENARLAQEILAEKAVSDELRGLLLRVVEVGKKGE